MCLLSGSVFFVYKLRRAEQMEKELPVKFKVAENRRKPFYSLLRRTTIFGTILYEEVCFSPDNLVRENIPILSTMICRIRIPSISA